MGLFTPSDVRAFRCIDSRRWRGYAETVDDRQKRVPGFSQDALRRLSVGVVGAGGLGGEFLRGAVKKGIGRIAVYDGDEVTVSNLNRQMFRLRDVGKNKAICLARNAARVGYLGSQLLAVPFYIQAAVDRGTEQPCDAVFCGVDNDQSRAFVAKRYLDRPAIFAAVSADAGHGFVAVQKPGCACFRCIHPQAFDQEMAVPSEDGKCPVDPAVIDIVAIVAMVASYALDSLVMDRPRTWNFKQIVLHGRMPDITAAVPKRADCPLCSSAKTEDAAERG
jgi:molybdopterin/thiamine biosynthesis adenylyltransferase